MYIDHIIPDNASVVIASDFHLDHRGSFIWNNRGYEDHIHHTTDLIDNISNHINNLPDDMPKIMIYLGDFSLNSTISNTLTYLHEITTGLDKLYYIQGNHESYIRKVKKIFESYNTLGAEATRGIIKLHDQGDTDLEDIQVTNLLNIIELMKHKIVWCDKIVNFKHKQRKFVTCHFPIAPASWDSNYAGSWMIHGHCHGTRDEFWKYHTSGYMLDVSVDVCQSLYNRVLFNWSDIEEQMTKKFNLGKSIINN